MAKTATTIRCVPRFGYEQTEVRAVELELRHEADERDLLAALTQWFHVRGVHDAIYDLQTDDDGFFAIVNDEAYEHDWGTPLL